VSGEPFDRLRSGKAAPTRKSFFLSSYFYLLSPVSCLLSSAPLKIFHLTAVFEEFNIMLTNMLAKRIANVTVSNPLYKVFSDGK
jgi:hypothetical protein